MLHDLAGIAQLLESFDVYSFSLEKAAAYAGVFAAFAVGWVALKYSARAAWWSARAAGRGARAAWRRATAAPEPSPFCAPLLAALAGKVEYSPPTAQRYATLKAGALLVSLMPCDEVREASVGGDDVLQHLGRRDHRLFAAAVRAAAARHRRAEAAAARVRILQQATAGAAPAGMAWAPAGQDTGEWPKVS